MVNFYRALLAPGAPDIAAALRLAMIQTLRDAPSAAFSNPRFWAPFVVLGDGGAHLAPCTGGAPLSQVEIVPGGGEILAMTAGPKGMTGSEIGPPANGR